MNTYEQRQADKKERLEARAEAARNASNSAYNRAKQMSDAIPFGQPIHIGHHSEQRDRNYRARIGSTMRKSIELDKKAAHYDDRAAAVGTGGISSDDPDAVIKLRAELATLTARQEGMKAVNKVVKAKTAPEFRADALVAMGYSRAEADELLQPVFGQVGHPGYHLSNNSANIRRIKARIAQLEKLATREPAREDHEMFGYREDTDENRVMFTFPGKPSADVRDVLKAHGFKWSPSRSAWVRQLSNAGIYAAQQVKARLS